MLCEAQDDFLAGLPASKCQLYADSNHECDQCYPAQPERIFHIVFGRQMAVPQRNANGNDDREKNRYKVNPQRAESIKSQKERADDPEKMKRWIADNKP